MSEIHIALGNTKLGRIPNISLPPVKTCRAGILCYKKCCAYRAWRMYPNVRKAWQDNLDVYKSDCYDYFEQIAVFVGKTNAKFFRFHVAGDIPDVRYWRGIQEISAEIPEVNFLVFTKRFDLDFSLELPNLSVVLSMWPGLENPTHLELPRAWCQDGTETRIPDDALECYGECENCGACWGLAKRGIDVVFPIH